MIEAGQNRRKGTKENGLKIAIIAVTKGVEEILFLDNIFINILFHIEINS